MKNKLYYTAPEVERVEIILEAGIMGFSSEGKGSANADAMTEDTETFGKSW